MTPQTSSLMKQFIQIDHTPYGEQLSTLVQLKLESGAQVDEVLQLIKELMEQLKRDQLDDDMDHADQMAKFKANIEILEVDLTRLNKELASTNDLIILLSDELKALRESIVTLENQLSILNGQEQLIRDARAADIKAFNRRVENANKVINALNLIISKLRNAIDQQDGHTTESVLAEVRKELGANHPISILIAMTAKFDVPTVERILEKLIQIRDGAIASLNQDQAAEVVAASSFDKSISEIIDIRKKLSIDLENCQQKFNQKTIQQTIAIAQKQQLLIDIPITEAILEATKIQMQQFHAAYVGRTEQRTQELNIIEKAYNLIFDHVDSVKRQENLSNTLNG